MIKKEGDSYSVYDGEGKKKLGEHETKESALRQLAAIHLRKIQNQKRLFNRG